VPTRPRDDPRALSLLLSGYLCGTHSGVLAHRARRRRAASGTRSGSRASAVAAEHRSLELRPHAHARRLGAELWAPQGAALGLRDRLRRELDDAAVVELVLFGSQARGGATGFSDVDALLVIRDEVAWDARALRRLRRRVLAAQREVLAYQPMQHHGFEIATPKLLGRADDALALPEVVFEGARSLLGGGVDASFRGRPDAAGAHARLRELVATVTRVEAWPSHPWRAHGLVSMFELVPSLYVQSRGRSTPKWRSFAEAAEDFPGRWSPYETLAAVRAAWPRRPRPALRRAASLARNPWAAVALWTRLPARVPAPVRSLLSAETLTGLQRLAGEMAERER
jgi:predicted nucleotidyltransferase